MALYQMLQNRVYRGDKKLVVNAAEAETVRAIFRRYLFDDQTL